MNYVVSKHTGTRGKIIAEHLNQIWVLCNDGSNALFSRDAFELWQPKIGDLVTYKCGTARVIGVFSDKVWVYMMCKCETLDLNEISPVDTGFGE
jgi:hypothetical protein